jgi:signal transduction histidine kinase
VIKSYILSVLLVIGLNGSVVYAQKIDSALFKTGQNAQLLTEDTTNFLDKFMIAELEKVQYAKYSKDLEKAALQKLIENQKLEKDKLQQKLQNEQLKAEAERRQIEAERIKIEAQRQQEIQEQKIKDLQIQELQQRETLQIRTRNFLYGGLVLLALLGISQLRANWQLKKRNKAIQKLSEENLEKEQEKQQILASQNETLETQVMERTTDLEKSLKDLQETQTQLIQKEKMASLGELTAGIAHEIQNPLNFVNNFAELSVDLAKDLNNEINKPDIDREYISEILADLTSNQEKINHHGKRASNIVKGMLEHSRTSTGIKELTDINRLADEYLRLSYHGMRAKDKTFNADFSMNLDENIPKLNIIPQDMGRVLLNLFNNAFYVVNEKKKTQKEGDYKPIVTVSSAKIGDSVEIKLTDNGNGIPDTIKQKIFQPFFTTKPTGEGTGLGLSLSYDIVTKGHGGTLEVVSTEGVGSEFIICLPLKTNLK